MPERNPNPYRHPLRPPPAGNRPSRQTDAPAPSADDPAPNPELQQAALHLLALFLFATSAVCLFLWGVHRAELILPVLRVFAVGFGIVMAFSALANGAAFLIHMAQAWEKRPGGQAPEPPE